MSIIKGTKSILIKAVNRIPRDIYYHKDYCNVLQLLNKQEKNINVYKELNKALANQLINAITNVPYYKNLNLNVKADDINANNAKEVIKLFPYTDKSTIMNNIDQFISNKYNKKSIFMFNRTSGGSTGNGIRVFRTLRELQIERAFYDYQWHKFGYKPSSKVVRMACSGIKKENEYPCSIEGDKLLVSPYHMNKRWIKNIYEDIKDFKVEFIHAYPSSLEYLLGYMKENSLKLESIKAVFLASEIVTPRVLDLIKEVLDNIPVNFSYGLTERSNLAWGFYKEGKICYRCDEVYGYSENYITEDGRHEIAGTSYWNTSMPFIRYKTQDVGKIKDKIIQSLDGRKQEFLITKNGEKIPGFSVSIDKFVWDYVEIMQVVQNKIGKIEFHIQPKDNYTEDTQKQILDSQIKKWGAFFDLKIIKEKEIRKTKSGKLRLIVNNLKL